MDSNININSPNKKSILKKNYSTFCEFEEGSNNNFGYYKEENINKSPIKKNQLDINNDDSLNNKSTTTTPTKSTPTKSPQKSPNKNKVSISDEAVITHRYLSKSPIKIIKQKKPLFQNYPDNNIDSSIKPNKKNDANDKFEIQKKNETSNNSNNDNDKKYTNNSNNNVNNLNDSRYETIFYESMNNSTAPIIKKPLISKFKEIFEYLTLKFDQIHEKITIILNENNKHSIYLIYLIAIILNLLLIGYSLNYLGPIFGLILLTISIANTYSFIKSEKEYQLLRYENKSFQSPNMSLQEIEYEGSIDKIPILKIWEPKYLSRVLFSLFNPLNIGIMFKAGPYISDFITFSSISFSISFLIFHFIKKYEQKSKDEKILFNQLVNEYNHFTRCIPSTKDKSTDSNDIIIIIK